jgi:hypothetical protein
MEQDIRWKQRFENFSNAFKRLQEAIHIKNPSDLSSLRFRQFAGTHQLRRKSILQKRS